MKYKQKPRLLILLLALTQACATVKTRLGEIPESSFLVAGKIVGQHREFSWQKVNKKRLYSECQPLTAYDLGIILSLTSDQTLRYKSVKATISNAISEKYIVLIGDKLIDEGPTASGPFDYTSVTTYYHSSCSVGNNGHSYITVTTTPFEDSKERDRVLMGVFEKVAKPAGHSVIEQFKNEVGQEGFTISQVEIINSEKVQVEYIIAKSKNDVILISSQLPPSDELDAKILTLITAAPNLRRRGLELLTSDNAKGVCGHLSGQQWADCDKKEKESQARVQEAFKQAEYDKWRSELGIPKGKPSQICTTSYGQVRDGVQNVTTNCR